MQYLDKKFFAINDGSKNYYYFYDLYSFLDTSLDKATMKFLGDSKLKILDAGKLNADIDYWSKHSDDIIRYCIQDAKLAESNKLYDWKERENDPDIKYCVKIILNSLYGKTIQVVGDENKTGKLFNQMYTSLITVGTRIKLEELL